MQHKIVTIIVAPKLKDQGYCRAWITGMKKQSVYGKNKNELIGKLTRMAVERNFLISTIKYQKTKA